MQPYHESIIWICYQFYICPNILFQMEYVESHDDRLITLKHFYGEYLCCSLFNRISVNARQGDYYWELYVDVDNDDDTDTMIVTLGSQRYGAQYGGSLRISDKYDVDIGRGGRAKFKIIKYPQICPNVVSLESQRYPGHFIAVNDKLSVYSHDINQPIHNYNDNYIYHKAPGKLKNIIPIALKFDTNVSTICNYIGICSNALHSYKTQLKSNIDEFCKWNMHIYQHDFIKFENVMSNKYLRIDNHKHVTVGGNGGVFTFQYDPIQKH